MVLLGEQEINQVKKFNTNMGYSGLGNLAYMGIINPAIDSAGARGLMKSSSLALEKALVSSPEAINVIHSHGFGSQFFSGVLNKIPFFNKILPDKATTYDNMVTRALFGKDNVVKYQPNLEKQIAGKQVTGINEKMFGKKLDAVGLSESDFLSTGFSKSNRKAIQAVEYMQNIGLKPDDLTNSRTLFEGVKGEEALNVIKNNWSKENLKVDIVNKVKSNLKSFWKNDDFTVEKITKTLGISKEQLDDFANKQIKKHGLKVAKEVTEEVAKEAVDIKNADEYINWLKTAKGETVKKSKQALRYFVNKTAIKNADEAGEILTTLTRAEKIASHPISRFITGSAGGLAGVVNIAGAIVGNIASRGQEHAINNFTELVLGRNFTSNEINVSNEATNHSIQKHLINNNSNIEEYNKIYYYRNFANDLRTQISPVEIEDKTLEDFSTM